MFHRLDSAQSMADPPSCYLEFMLGQTCISGIGETHLHVVCLTELTLMSACAERLGLIVRSGGQIDRSVTLPRKQAKAHLHGRVTAVMELCGGV